MDKRGKGECTIEVADTQSDVAAHGVADAAAVPFRQGTEPDSGGIGFYLRAATTISCFSKYAEGTI